jgi:hypothetical protein
MFVDEPEVSRTLGRPRRGLKYNIKIDFKQIGSDGVDWI